MKGNNSQNDRSLKLMQSFWSMQKNLMRHVQKTAAENGLSVTQYNILMMLIHHKEIPQKDLQEKTYLPKSTLSQAINGLVDSGYLVRQQMKDNRREIELSICQKGKDLIQTINSQKNGILKLCQNAVESLTDEEFNNVINIQQQIAANFKEPGSDHTC